MSVVDAVNGVVKNEGRIDVLINNAGYGEYGAIEDVSIENAKKQMEVNLFGLARMTRQVLPHMRRQKSGKIINISSIGGKMATPMGGWYYASKFAVEGLSDSLRMEVKQFGVDVIVVEPGGILSEWAGIAANIMLAASGNTVYAHFAEKAASSVSLENKLPKPITISLGMTLLLSSPPFLTKRSKNCRNTTGTSDKVRSLSQPYGNFRQSPRPVATLREASDKGRKPVVTLREASDKGRKPVVTLREASDKSRKPVVTLRETSDKGRKPVVTLRETSDKGRKPAYVELKFSYAEFNVTS